MSKEHKCSKEKEISVLEKTVQSLADKQESFMDIITEIREDVKEIKKFIFEGPMEDKFVPKSTFDLTVQIMEEKFRQRTEEIKQLKANQNKVVWIIITAFLLAVAGLVIAPKVL